MSHTAQLSSSAASQLPTPTLLSRHLRKRLQSLLARHGQEPRHSQQQQHQSQQITTHRDGPSIGGGESGGGAKVNASQKGIQQQQSSQQHHLPTTPQTHILTSQQRYQYQQELQQYQQHLRSQQQQHLRSQQQQQSSQQHPNTPHLRPHNNKSLHTSSLKSSHAADVRCKHKKWVTNKSNDHTPHTTPPITTTNSNNSIQLGLLNHLEARYKYYMESIVTKTPMLKKRQQQQNNNISSTTKRTPQSLKHHHNLLPQHPILHPNMESIPQGYHRASPIPQQVSELSDMILQRTAQNPTCPTYRQFSNAERLAALPVVMKQFNQSQLLFSQMRAYTTTTAHCLSKQKKSSTTLRHKYPNNTTPLKSKQPPTTTTKRFTRRRYFVDPAVSHNYGGLAQGLGYATRLEDKFQPGSTHIVSALPVFEMHEYREPILLRSRYVPLRAFRRLTDRPFKMYLWLLLIPPVSYAFITTLTLWDMATRTRTIAKEYLSQAGLAMQLRQLRVMIDQDLIAFQNEEAKHAFIGVLNGVEEDVKVELNGNQMLRHLQRIVRLSFIQPMNEMIKPKKQKIFFEYSNLQHYNRAVDNIHNRKAVNLTEASLYRLTNQQRQRYQVQRRITTSAERQRALGQDFGNQHMFMQNRWRHGHLVAFETKYGPLLRSFDNLPGYFWWGSLVALAESFWLRDTRHPILGPTPGNLFTIRPVENNGFTRELRESWYAPAWRRIKGTVDSLDIHLENPFKMWFTQDRTFDRSTSRIRDADGLLREMERYVVQGDYVKLPTERIEDPHDPLLRGIPDYVLNHSDKTMSGPLYSWYNRKLMDKDVDSWSLYRRFLLSEFLLLKKTHDWLRACAYIQLGQQVPPANIQGYLKFYDESHLPFPEHKYKKGDMDFHVDEVGIWDEVVQYARHVEDEMNDQALNAWLEFGNSKDTFEPTRRLTESIYAVMPLRGNYTTHDARDVDYFKNLRAVDPFNTHYYRGKKHKAETLGKWDDPKLGQAIEAWDQRGDHHTELMQRNAAGIGKAEQEGKITATQAGRWYALVGKQLEQEHRERNNLKRPDQILQGTDQDNNFPNDLNTTPPTPRPVPDHEFVPVEAHLPWPKGFFMDEPPINDPFYFTRKYGLGTRKDWDRMVRLGAWEDVEHLEDQVASTIGHIPKIWDPDGLHSHNLPIFLHDRTHRKLTKKLKEEGPKAWDNTELLWLNVVQNKLMRSRRAYNFSLFPAPHERNKQAKFNHGSSFFIDCEAKQDLFTSNQYSDDWLLFSQMPSMYPVAPPLHEMNFMTTLISRVEGCIMQHSAEIDLAALKIRELMMERAEHELQGLMAPTTSLEIQHDDELQMFLNHRPVAGQITQQGTAAGSGDSEAGGFGNFDEKGDRLRYQDKLDPYAWLGQDWTNRQLMVSNLRDMLDTTLDTLTGRGVFWDVEEYKEKEYLRRRIRQTLNHTGLRVKDVMENSPRLRFYYSNRLNTFIPAYYAQMHRNGDIHRIGVPQQYMEVLTAGEWLTYQRDEALQDRVLNRLFNKKIAQFKKDYTMARYLLKDWEAYRESRTGRQAVIYRDDAGREKKIYHQDFQIHVDPRLHGKEALINKYRAARKRDPFDRTKTWEMYYRTDARPERTARDPHTGDPTFFRRFASRMLEEVKHDQTMDPSAYHQQTSYEEKPLMKARKEAFLRRYGHVDEAVTAFQRKEFLDKAPTKEERATLYKDRDEYEKFRTSHIKKQVENTITLDNLEEYQRLKHLMDRAGGGAETSRNYDMFNPDYYLRNGGIPDPLDEVATNLFKQNPYRTAGYAQLDRRFYFPQ